MSETTRALNALIEVLTESGIPVRALRPEARLESDLGLRPARLGEIARLGAARIGLQPPADLGAAKTLSDLARAIEGMPRAAARPPLADKVAFVTGSGHGLGRSLAVELAMRGATVVVNSFHSRDRGEATAAELREAGCQAVHIWGSVAQPRQLDDMFLEIEKRFGRLDVFIQNASNGYLGPLEFATPEHWEKSYRTNVVSLHQGAMRAAALMKEGGCIAALSSPAAQRCTPMFGLQGSVKAAVESLVRYLALELAPKGIRVNAYAPGPVYGELLFKYPEASRLVPSWEVISAGYRLSTEEEVARSVVSFMIEPALMATGAFVLSDAGVSKGM
jgi:enoyl-[acyl-carrier protein] reductase III